MSDFVMFSSSIYIYIYIHTLFHVPVCPSVCACVCMWVRVCVYVQFALSNITISIYNLGFHEI